MILNPAQAEAVHKALRAMDEAGGKSYDLRFDSGIVSIDFRGAIRIEGKVASENYSDLPAFATAYGLN